jgi:hypothetical protein
MTEPRVERGPCLVQGDAGSRGTVVKTKCPLLHCVWPHPLLVRPLFAILLIAARPKPPTHPPLPPVAPVLIINKGAATVTTLPVWGAKRRTLPSLYLPSIPSPPNCPLLPYIHIPSSILVPLHIPHTPFILIHIPACLAPLHHRHWCLSQTRNHLVDSN